MKTYQIEYRGKLAKARGESARDALERYARRRPFGRGPIFAQIRTVAVDAETGGKIAGVFWAPAGDGARTLIGVVMDKWRAAANKARGDD